MRHNEGNLPNAAGVLLMENNSDNVLTIEELSAYLKIPKSTLYKLVREGKIPAQKVGRHLRFLRESIDEWLRRQNEYGRQG
jgi:excisionase family DNA binding protein